MVSYCGLVEPVFKALSDQTRRELLDELFRRDGQTLNALASRFDMTRVAVAKHLRLLEAAGLVVSRRSGREKLHYLNPVPIRLVHDRWVSKYTEGWAAGLADLKRDMEATVEKVFEIYIRTTPEQLVEQLPPRLVGQRLEHRFHESTIGNLLVSCQAEAARSSGSRLYRLTP